MSAENFKLDVWVGDWGLPSIDPNSLAVLAFCKFSNIPVEVSHTANTWVSPSGTLPVLRTDESVITKVPDMLTQLTNRRRQHQEVDPLIVSSPKDGADTVAFCAMLEEKLLPAMLHLWWLDEQTYSSVARPWYGRTMPFPLYLFVPWRTQRLAELRVAVVTQGSEHMTSQEAEARVYRDAKECLTILSYKLGENPYFFGAASPSLLDARVFGYLATLMKIPLLRNHQLQAHLKQCENLTAFVTDILTTYFPDNLKEYEESVKKREEEKKKNASNHSEYPDRLRKMALAAMFSVTCMLGYAVTTGLLQVQVFDAAVVPKTKRSMTISSTDKTFTEQE